MSEMLYEPATGRPICPVKHDGAERIAEAVSTARTAQRAWEVLSLEERARVIRRLSRLISEREEVLAEMISRCTGKTMTDAMAGDVAPAGIAADWYARAACRYLKTRRLRRGHIFFLMIKRSYLRREPLGVVGIIGPWNYPFSIPMQETLMALMAGNGVVLKVATQTQPVGEAMIELLADAGVPEGLVNLVHVPGAEAGPAFLASDIDKLMFTGSLAVGKRLAVGAAERLMPIGLELGGNDAMIVLSDACIERAARGALWCGMSNAGQSCGGVERIIVEEPAWERFRSRFAELVRNMRVGYDAYHATDIGSLTSEKQLRVVKAHVADATKKGATIAAESAAPESGKRQFFHRAVVLENVTSEMDVLRHETFGPVVTLQRASDEDEAIRMANDSYLGLSASVWTTSRRRAFRVAAQLEAGSIGVNDHLMPHGMAETPWGGYKRSSMGRTHGRLGLEAMTQPKVIVVDRFARAPHQIWWLPNSSKGHQTVVSVLRFLYGPERLRATGMIIAGFIKGLIRGPRIGSR
jgi:acyl-CoA reductase-like NAD-dependent aldehyde dehydrogenase